MLRGVLPMRFGLGWGHISVGTDDLAATKPLDVIINDQPGFAPIYADGSFVVAPPQAAAAIIEVKATVTGGETGTLSAACDQLRQAASRIGDESPHIGLLAGSSPDGRDAGKLLPVVSCRAPDKVPVAWECLPDDDGERFRARQKSVGLAPVRSMTVHSGVAGGCWPRVDSDH